MLHARLISVLLQRVRNLLGDLGKQFEEERVQELHDVRGVLVLRVGASRLDHGNKRLQELLRVKEKMRTNKNGVHAGRNAVVSDRAKE